MIIRANEGVFGNGCVYETLGIASFVPIRRYKCQCGAERLNQPLNPQCFIHDFSCGFSYHLISGKSLNSRSVILQFCSFAEISKEAIKSLYSCLHSEK